MVSFWPWKGDPSSTASFEKTLSALSAKIADTQTRLDGSRARARRARVLGTLYLSFAYLVYAIVLLFVVGRAGLGAYEWSGIAAGPVLIYAFRAGTASYYGLRVERIEARLRDHQEERARTIQKLKDATKYDSTLELIEKYGGAEGTPAKGAKADDGTADQAKGSRPTQPPGRTTMPLPPTANIQNRSPSPATPSPRPSALAEFAPGAEFAPNAFAAPPPSALAAPPPPAERRWYDRVFDVLLGEDETAPKNRFALICRSCRRVNGQAPPGARSPADAGLWKCMACGAPNSDDATEGARIVREVLRQQAADGHDEHGAADKGDGPESEGAAEPAGMPEQPSAKKQPA